MRSTIRRFLPNWPVLLAGGVSLLLSCYAQSLPNILTGVHGFTGHGYDDGVYFGAAIAFIHGSWPYRDFAFVQPPGIIALMSPIAFIGRLIGDRDALMVARCVTVLVGAVNAGLIAWMLRHRGKIAMLLAGLTFALFPLSVTANSTLMLEPYVVLFCLIGVAIAFHGDSVATPNRLFLAGLFFGIAGAVKLWAIFPVAALIIFLVFSARWTLKRFCQGTVVGFLVVIGPFFAASPVSFVRDVLIAQEGRISLASFGSGLSLKVLDVTGLAGLGSYAPPQYVGVIIAAAVIALMAAAMWFARSYLTSFDRFIAMCTLITVFGMLSGTVFFQHYAYFTAAFLSLLAGVCVGAVVAKLKSTNFAARPIIGRLASPAPLTIVGTIALVGCVLVAHADTQFSNSYLTQTQDNGATLAAVIPAGSCVIADEISYLIDANRLTSSQSNCPVLIDYYGTWLQDDPAHLPPTDFYSSSLIATWNSWLRRADYVVLISPQSSAYPRAPSTVAIFNDNYRLVYSAPGTYAYCHVPNPNSSSSEANTYLRLGIAAQDNNQLAQAVTDYDHSLAITPCSAPALYDLGLIDETQGNTNGAIALYQEVLAIYPTYEPALTRLSGIG
ncbi:MAG TPA: hypothetical protein VII67_01680 [Acidimicrobiales bacterium]